MDSVMLVEAENVRVTRLGLEQYELQEQWVSSSELHSHGITVDGKHPQLFASNESIYLVSSRGIWDATNRSLTPIGVKNPLDYDSHEGRWGSGHIGGSRRWSFGVIGSSWVGVNGSTFLFKLPMQVGFPNNVGMQGFILATSRPKVRSCISWHGRLLYGGFVSGEVWPDEWESFWRKWLNRHGEGAVLGLDLGESYIWWTGVGAPDAFWFVFPDMALTGYLSVVSGWYGDVSPDELFHQTRLNRPMIFDLLKRGDIGFMPVERIGTIQRLIRMGDSIAVYGDHGVALLKEMIEPATGFGQHYLASISLANEGAVADGHLGNLVVTGDGLLVLLTNKVTVLGYKEFISDLDLSRVTVLYNEQLQEYYICDGAKCFIYTEYGMGETSQIISDVVNRNGKTYVLSN